MRAIERAKFRLFLLVGLSIAAYAIAAGNAIIAALALPVWLLAWPVAFGPKGKHLPRAPLNLLALAATAMVLLRAFAAPSEIVTGVAAYLVFILLLKLFDRSAPRDLGVLFLASVFLVIGACLTSNALAMGLALALYAPLAVWTAMSLELHAAYVGAADSRRAVVGVGARLAATLPQAGARADRSLRRTAAAALAGCFVFAVAVFIVMPRNIGAGVLGALQANEGAQSGFDDEVDLAGKGILSESPEPVLEVQITNEHGVNVGPSLERILLRGAVLDDYEDGSWRRGRRSRSRSETIRLGSGVSAPLPTGSREEGPVYVQRIILRDKKQPHLFAMLRPVEITSDRVRRVTVGEDDFELTSDDRGLLEYTVVSQPGTPAGGAPEGADSGQGFASQPVRDLALRVLRDAGLWRDEGPADGADSHAITRALEQHLQRNYTYTTQLATARAGQDPIEMFLFERREGHCEYFASALAAMSRSIGIPARVVTGYVAVEYNESTGRFLVRESNAHAWVEALVDADAGAWETFDPSPPDQLALVHRPPGGLWGDVRRAFDAVEYWWISNVVAYDNADRESVLGGRISALEAQLSKLSGVADMLRGPRALRITLQSLAHGLIAFALVAAGGFVAPGVWRWWRSRLGAWRSRSAQPRFARTAAAQPRFYKALLRELRKAGLPKPATVPPMAHVEAIAPKLGDPSAVESLRQLVRAYYEARFSGRDDADAEAAAGLLPAVRRRLRQRRGRRWSEKG